MHSAAPIRTMKPRRKSFGREFMKQWDMQILVIPSILLIILFSYVPMYGVIMGFQDFRMGDFPGFSSWVGMKHFIKLFNNPYFPRAMLNTFIIAMLKMFINFPLPIAVAVLFNELRSVRFRKIVQTISYLPHFVSWVVAAMLMMDMLSTDGGTVNAMLMSLGFIEKPIFFFGKGEYFKWMAVYTDIWKELGWNTIIFCAAITSIDAELYEAAEIDGAGRWAKMWHVTIATIRPTIVLLLIFTIGGLLRANFDQIMMLTGYMTNAKLRPFADVIDTFVYRVGLGDTVPQFSFAAAAGLFQSLANFALLLIANYVAGKISGDALI